MIHPHCPIVDGYPLVNVYITMENQHVQWVNPLSLWPCSIAMLVYQRVNPLVMMVESRYFQLLVAKESPYEYYNLYCGIYWD